MAFRLLLPILLFAVLGAVAVWWLYNRSPSHRRSLAHAFESQHISLKGEYAAHMERQGFEIEWTGEPATGTILEFEGGWFILEPMRMWTSAADGHRFGADVFAVYFARAATPRTWKASRLIAGSNGPASASAEARAMLEKAFRKP